MHVIISNKSKLVSFIYLSVVGVTLYTCDSSDKLLNDTEQSSIAHANGENFIGSESCQSCHQDIYQSHLATAHYLSSAESDTRPVKGRFQKGRNILPIGEMLEIMMTKEERRLAPPRKVPIVFQAARLTLAVW